MSLFRIGKKRILNSEEPNQDVALGELSQIFLECPDDPTPGSEFLDRSLFDFTVESLVAMDAYLSVVQNLQMSQISHGKVVLRAGAYVGEVIRRHIPPPRELHWLAYAQAARLNPLIDSFGMSMSVAAVLWDAKDGFMFPLAKVNKFLQNGIEDSVHFFAQITIAGLPPSQ